MRTLPLTLAALSLCLATAVRAETSAPPSAETEAAATTCPPGLARPKADCRPRGQAKKGRYQIGDRILGDHVVLTNPYRYGLDGRGTYWRVGDRVYQVDGQTGEILAILGGLSNLMN